MNLMPLLWLILYPLSPALRLYELVRWFLGRVLYGLEDPDYIAEQEENPEELAKLDRWLCDMESLLHIVIGYMARDKLGRPFRDHRRSGRARSRPGKRPPSRPCSTSSSVSPSCWATSNASPSGALGG